ncbi:MAG TPA: hypothetical protein PLA71_00500 [Saccharofermentans sp.]|nr:hypothetical protein [Saccharofermentans sp.]
MTNYIEVFQLTAGQAAAKQLELTRTPKLATIKVAVGGQPFWIYGIDYTAYGRIIDWNLATNNILAGHTVLINYEEDETVLPNNVSNHYIALLTASDISNGYVDLPETPLDTDSIGLYVRKGGVQIPLVDYTWNLVGTRIYWTASDLSTALEVGDVLVVEYSAMPYTNAELKVKEQIVVNSTMLQTKRINLTNVVNRYRAVEFTIEKAGYQSPEYDYLILENAIAWNKLGLDGMLRSGDVIEIIYHSFENGLPDDFRIYKVNEDFDITAKLKEYAGNQEWTAEAATFWEVIQDSSDKISELLYERISNFVQNLKDIDTCNLHALYSMSKEMDQDNLFAYDMYYPHDLDHIMNIFSCNPSLVLANDKLLHDDVLSALWSSNLVTNFQTMSISAFVDTMNQDHFVDDLTDDYTYDDVRLQYSFANAIWKSDYIYFLDTTIEQVFRSNMEGWLTIDQDYIDHPEKYEDNNDVKYQIYKYGIAQEYLGFLDSIFDVPICFNSTTSGDVIRRSAKILRNICMKAYVNRENLKNMSQKYSMLGSHAAVEKLLGETLLRKFSKSTDWNIYVGDTTDLIDSTANRSYTESISAEIFLNTYMPAIRELSASSVEVIEYYDKTEYMNISAQTAYKTGIIDHIVSPSTVVYIDTNGNLVSSTTMVTSDVYGPDSSLGPVKTSGNVRYWDPENMFLYKLSTEHTSADVRDFYRNVGLDDVRYGEDTLDGVDGLLCTVFDKMAAVSGYERDAIIPDLTSQVCAQYRNYQRQDVPSSHLVNSPVDLSPIDRKYSGQTSGDLPWVNHKNTVYPSIAITPLIWNLVEKAYLKYPTVLQTLTTSMTDSLDGLVDLSGNLMNSWKYNGHEFTAYQTKFEESNNLDYKFQENEYVDREGPFNGESVLRDYLKTTDPADYNELSGYYKHIKSLINYTNSIPDEELDKMEFFRSHIVALSGETIYDHDKMCMDYSSWLRENPYKEVVNGKVITAYDVDQFGNSHMLYKTSYDLLVPGTIWTRIRNWPLPYPMAYGFVENVESLEDAQTWLLDNNILIKGDEEEWSDVVTSTHYAGNISGSTYSYYDMVRLADGYRVAQWHADTSTNPANEYSELLLIVDPNLQQFNIGNSQFENLMWAVNHCYDFRCVNEDLIVIGQDYSISGNVDKIYIFQTELVEEVYKGGSNDCLNKQDYEIYKNFFRTSFDEDKYPGSLEIPGGIGNYVGMFVDASRTAYVFVFVNNIEEGSITLDFRFFDYKTRKWKTIT